MLARSRRYLLIIALLLGAVGLTWIQRLSYPGEDLAALSPSEETPAGERSEAPLAGAAPEPSHIYFLDVDGWYRITPYETVVRSHLDLAAESTKAMAAAIPGELGEWRQVGEDEDVADDPAVEFYLREPTVALQRIYEDPKGQRLTLTIIGNKGEDSFLLFSHTPETCYPGRLWQVVENRRESAVLDALQADTETKDHAMHAQYLLTEHAETQDRLMVLYWYLWDDPQRKSEEGVLSVRVSLFIPPELTEEEALSRAWAFVRLLFPSTLHWDRF